MTDTIPTWQLVLDAAEGLTRRGSTPFQLQTLVREVQRLDPSREFRTFQPTVQGMTINAGKGPLSRAGKPLERVSHGYYQLRSACESDSVVAEERRTERDHIPTLDPGVACSKVERGLATAVGDLATLIDSELEHVLTEDVLRFSTIKALVEEGVSPRHIRTEVRVAGVGAIDLVVGPVAVELKFPRDPTKFGAADTMTLGELIKDFYKVAHSGFERGMVAQMTDERLRRYFLRRRPPEPLWKFEPGSRMRFGIDSASALPKSAGTPGLLALAARGSLEAKCLLATRAQDWVLAVWSVETRSPD